MSDQQEYNEYINLIQNEITFLGYTEDLLEFCEQKRREYIQTEKETVEALKNTNPNRSAMAEIKELATEILLDQMVIAIENFEEFNEEVFKEAFFECAYKPGAISLALSGQTLMVKVNMNKVAGRIDEYASAIIKTRRAMQIGPYRRGKKGKRAPLSPAWASLMWREKYYGSAREGGGGLQGKWAKKAEDYAQAYWDTIAMRMSFMPSGAPFWSIIDQGNKPLRSDYGGTSYPEQAGEHFVDKTVARIQRKFAERKAYYIAEYNNAVKLVKKLREVVKYIDEEIVRIGNAINAKAQYWLGKDSAKSARATQARDYEEFYREHARSVIEERTKQRFQDADLSKLQELLDELVAGDEIPYRINIGTRGKQVRIRTKALQRSAALFREKYNEMRGQ